MFKQKLIKVCQVCQEEKKAIKQIKLLVKSTKYTVGGGGGIQRKNICSFPQKVENLS